MAFMKEDWVIYVLSRKSSKAYTDGVALQGVPIQYPKIVNGTWQNFDPISGQYIDTGVYATGADGREIELQNDGTNISWRYVGDTSWTVLTPLLTLKGDKGEDGKEVQIRVSDENVLQWKYNTDSNWTDLIDFSDVEVSAEILPYESGKQYSTNEVFYDPNTGKIYAVKENYTSTSIESDFNNGYIANIGGSDVTADSLISTDENNDIKLGSDQNLFLNVTESVVISPKEYNNVSAITSESDPNFGLYSKQEVIEFDHTPTSAELALIPEGSIISIPNNGVNIQNFISDVVSDGGSGLITGVNKSGNSIIIETIPIRVDNITILGDGINTVLSSPRQGVELRSGFATVSDVPLPYDNTVIYLVGTSDPIYQMVVGDDGQLHTIGSTMPNLDGYVKEATADGNAYVRKDNAWSKPTASDIITGSGGTLQDKVNQYDSYDNRLTNIENSLSGVATVQEPEYYTYDGTKNVFQLPKTPDVVFDVLGLNDNNMFYFERSEITVDKTAMTVTINSSDLIANTRVKINYTAI